MEFLLKFWRYPEIRNRLLVTLGVLFILRLGCQIPPPFMAFDEWRVHPAIGPGKWLLSIFAIGISGYISILALLMLAARFIPFMRRRMGKGEAKRANIRRLSYVIVLPLYGLQAFLFVSIYSQNPGIDFDGLAQVAIIFSLVAGSYLMLFLARLLSLYGIASGIPMILLAMSLRAVYGGISRSMESIGYIEGMGEGHTVFGFIFILAVVIAVLIQEAYRPVTGPSPGGGGESIPGNIVGANMRIKIDYAGAMALVFATFVVGNVILIIELCYAGLWNRVLFGTVVWSQALRYFGWGTLFNIILIAIVLIPCHKLARNILFDPEEESSEAGGSEIDPSFSRVVGRISSRVGVLGALGVMAIYLAPKIAIKAYDLKFDVDPMLFFFAAVVALDGLRRLEHLFRARGEDGPLTKLGLNGLADGESWDKRMPW